MGSDALARIAHLFARAATDPSGWMPALDAMAAATNSGHGEILFLDRRNHRPSAWWMTHAEVVDQHAFHAAGGYDPRANVRIAATASPFSVVHEGHYDALRPTLATGDLVHDVFVDARIEAGCQTVLACDRDRLIGLAVLRGGRDGRTSAADRAMFEAILPFARDAALTSVGLEQQGAMLMAGAFGALSAAVFVLDRAGRVVAQTGAADAVLRAGRLQIVDGRLGGGHPALSAAIAARLSPDPDLPPPPLATVALPGDARGTALLADVSALPRREWTFGGAPAVLVVVRGGALRREGAVDLTRQAWDLSRAEAEIVVALAGGEARGAIAARRGVSVETVRAQMKSIFVKVGVTREAELAARAAALIGGG